MQNTTTVAMKKCLGVHEIHYISVLGLAVLEGVFTCISIPGELIAASMFDDSPSSGKDLSASSASWNDIVNNSVTGKMQQLTFQYGRSSKNSSSLVG